MNTAILESALGLPTPEHRVHRTPKLIPRIGRECDSTFAFDDGLERRDELLQIRRLQIDFSLHPAGANQFGRGQFHRVGVTIRLDPEHDVSVHLDESPVRVVRKPRIARVLGQCRRRGVVEPEV